MALYVASHYKVRGSFIGSEEPEGSTVYQTFGTQALSMLASFCARLTMSLLLSEHPQRPPAAVGRPGAPSLLPAASRSPHTELSTRGPGRGAGETCLRSL